MTETGIDVADYKAQVFGTPIAETPVIVEEPIVTETITPETIVDTPASDNPEVIVETPVVEQPAPIDQSVFLKENFGYEDLNQIKADLEEFKKLRETPQTPAEIAFANEESKRIHQLIKEGKTKEVREYLNAQDRIASLDGMNDEQKLKLYIKMENPLFDDELIEDEFKSLYTLKNEEDFIDDPLTGRKEKLRLAQRKENDVKKANEFFTKYKENLVLPEIAPAATNEPDPDYLAFQENRQKAEQVNASWIESLQKVSENETAFKFSFNDEANKIKFDTDFKMDKEGFEQARANAANYDNYLKERYFNSDGSPKGDQLVKDIYAHGNLDKMMAESNKNAVNTTIKWFLANQKNVKDSEQRSYITPPTSEIQALKQQIFG